MKLKKTANLNFASVFSTVIHFSSRVQQLVSSWKSTGKQTQKHAMHYLKSNILCILLYVRKNVLKVKRCRMKILELRLIKPTCCSSYDESYWVTLWHHEHTLLSELKCTHLSRLTCCMINCHTFFNGFSPIVLIVGLIRKKNEMNIKYEMIVWL